MKLVERCTGGFFDGKTGAEKRRQYLLDLFKHASAQSSCDNSSKTLSNLEVMHTFAHIVVKHCTDYQMLGIAGKRRAVQ